MTSQPTAVAYADPAHADDVDELALDALDTLDGSRQGHDITPATRADLMPPWVHEARRARKLRSLILLALTVLASALILGYVVLQGVLAAEQTRETRAAEEAGRLRDSLAQFSQVTGTVQSIAETKQALTMATAYQVDWQRLFRELSRLMPVGSTMSNFSVQAISATQGAAMAGVHELAEPGIGSVSVSFDTKELPDLATWLDRVNATPGFHDAWYTTATLDAGAAVTAEDGTVTEATAVYRVTATIGLDSDALAHPPVADEASVPDDVQSVPLPVPEGGAEDQGGDQVHASVGVVAQ